jgi:hypothetical protein
VGKCVLYGELYAPIFASLAGGRCFGRVRVFRAHIFTKLCPNNKEYMKPNRIHLLQIIYTALIVFLSCYFLFGTDGFVGRIYSSDGSISYSGEYESNGSNDNGIMFLFIGTRAILLFLSLLLSFLLRYKAWLQLLLLLLYTAAFFFELLCLSLIGDTSDVGQTIVHNKIFLMWFLIWLNTIPFYFFVLIKLARPKPIT